MRAHPFAKFLLPVIASVAVGTFETTAQTVLFSDNFNRSAEAAGDANLLQDVDFSTTGMGGQLISNGTLTVSNAWLEPEDSATANESRSQINTSDQLLLAVGFGTSHIVVNNNFANQISSSGVLSVQLAVPAWPTLDGEPLHRYMGFGIGGSEFELNVTGDRRLSRAADLFVAVTQNGLVRINDDEPSLRPVANNVAPTAQVDLDPTATAFLAGTLRADLYIPNTDFGSTVLYDLFFDDGSGFVQIATNRSFNWTGYSELYIGLDGRSSDRAPGDDFSVSFTEMSVDPQVSLSVSPDETGENTSSNQVMLTFSTFAVPFDATYRIVADKPASYPFFNDTGSAAFPQPVPAVVDGTLGEVTFTIYVSNNTPALIASASATVTTVEEAPALENTLFADNYNRWTGTDDDLDIDSSTNGMSGMLAPLTYLETCEHANISTTNYNDLSTYIGFDGNFNEVCSMANGPGMTIWGLDHNFTDQAILTDGGFSIAIDVTEINTATDDAADRYAGFGVGLSLAEINAFQDENSGDQSGPRGAVQDGTRHSGMADFHTSVSLDNVVRVFAAGVLVNEIQVSTNRGRLRADFGVNSFDAGAFVAYRVYFAGLLKSEGFFRWSADNQNYVGVSARGTVNVNADNLEIGTVNVPFLAPAEHPDIDLALTSFQPAGAPPFTRAGVQFTSISGARYRVDVTGSITNQFVVAPGPVGGEAVFTATNSTATGMVDLPAGMEDLGFLKLYPVSWPGPLVP